MPATSRAWVPRGARRPRRSAPRSRRSWTPSTSRSSAASRAVGGLSEERVRELATGEVWLGEQALELGLVDELGDLERAVELAAEAAGVPPRSSPVRIRRPFVARLAGRFASSFMETVADEVEARLESRLRT